MRAIKTLSIILAVLAGLAAGLGYGWLINPAPAVNTSLDSLRQDYKADFVLMAAEAYEKDGNLDLASQRVGFLGGSPAETANQAVIYASGAGYMIDDLRRMAALTKALQTMGPSTAPTGGQP